MKHLPRLLALFIVVVPIDGLRAQDAKEPTNFARDIQPILSENCYFCHGPDENHREADLRLDQEKGALAAITPGNSQESELVRRILSKDESDQMPPPDSNRALTNEQIELIQRWIDQGATWGQHWSFEPIQEVAIPEPDLANWPQWQTNPIDRFVLKKLQERERSPSVP
ncbi:MAG: hypothetical protein KDA80_13600, partial [Planctomycetaceae bacterium]|nr:hypothetical protein [Planctomycetaceae bacterium]